MNRTPEQILALAPDAASAKSGRDLAAERKWVTLNREESRDENSELIWGECQGSGKTPYRTQVDTGDLAFKCTCPSRKFPCKHALGLFLLRASQPAAFTIGEPPAWVKEWQDARNTRAQKQAEKATKVNPEENAGVDPAVSVVGAAKRLAARERKVTAGLAELELWLCDIVRQGLASLQGKSADFWETAAARLVDAQAPGAARLVRLMGRQPTSGDGWERRLLHGISLLHLLVEAYKRQAELSLEQATDVRTLVGWTIDQAEVKKHAGVSDHWLVVGRVTEDEDRMQVERIWLWGAGCDRAALVLNFTPAGQSHAAQTSQSLFVPGDCFKGEVVFFHGAHPLRALVKERVEPDAAEIERLENAFLTEAGFAELTTAVAAYTAALARNPWIERFPMLLRGVVPQHCGDDCWVVRDAANHCLPLAKRFDGAWRLLAESGGRPIRLFGEWDGSTLLPLSIWSESRLHFLN
ncbi:MAG: SWIM zinc finger domain-containing protein [Pyrinomonadaceae bacterium MAG19_C2-C3]|nr:SWIM zinc finger domain-containing protein [Pyrinomonadaceae bacterium MAG19_C2-C3]